LLGWEIHPSARVGLSLVLVPHLKIEADAVIGNFNIIRSAGSLRLSVGSMIKSFNVINGCELVELGSFAIIGYGNLISGPPLSTGLFPHSPDRRPEFRLGEHASVVRNHRIECSDMVEIGRFSTIGGTQTEILTHGIDIFESVQRTAPVTIGEYCYFGSRIVIQSGATVPARCVVAPGAVVNGSPGGPEQLLGGVPAKTIKDLTGAKYFKRDRGQID